MHPSPDSAAKKPRGRSWKQPSFEQPIADTKAASTEVETAAKSEGVDTLSAQPPGDAVPVRKRRGRPPKKTLPQTPPTAPVVRHPRGQPKKPRPVPPPQQPHPLPQQPLPLPQKPLPPPPQQAAVVETQASTQAVDAQRLIHPIPLQQPKVLEAKQRDRAEATTPVVSGESSVVPTKKRRGRPPKHQPSIQPVGTPQESPIKPKRPRGRPKQSSLLPEPQTASPQPKLQASSLLPKQQTEISANSVKLESKPEDPSSATSTPTKRPRGRPPKNPKPPKPPEPVATADIVEATKELECPPAVPDQKPRGRARKKGQPKRLRPTPATHPAAIENSPQAMKGKVLAASLAGVKATEEQVPDASVPGPPLPVPDREETAKVNFMDAPNIPLPFEILSKVRSVLPPEEATGGKEVLQQAEPPTMACTVANGVHTVLSPVINVGMPWKRPLAKDSAEDSSQTFEGPPQAREPPIKRRRRQPPKKRQGLTQSPTAEISSAPVKRRPGRPRKHPPPTPSSTEMETSTEAKPAGDTLTEPDPIKLTVLTLSTTVEAPIKQGKPEKSSLSSSTATAWKPPTSPPPTTPERPRKTRPEVGETSRQASPPLPVKRRPGRPRKRPLEPEPGEKPSDGGPTAKKRRGRPPKKKRIRPNETDETSSVCSPDEGTLTAQVKAVMTALPTESAFEGDSKAASAAIASVTSSPSKVPRDGSFQLRLSVSFSDSSDDMDTEKDTRTVLQILAGKVHGSGADTKAELEESEDESSSSYQSAFD